MMGGNGVFIQLKLYEMYYYTVILPETKTYIHVQLDASVKFPLPV